MFSLDKIMNAFGYYLKQGDNLRKLMSLFHYAIDDLYQATQTVDDWRDVDKAIGRALDRIGENVGQPRGNATDEVYRILIKSKIARNLSDGTINTIINILATALGVDFNTIRIEEKFNDPEEPEPAAIKVLELPIQAINKAGLDPINFVRIVKATVAGGISVGSIELTGTFEFSNDNSIDNTKGFGDINNPIIGGYLGAAYSPEDIPDLPI